MSAYALGKQMGYIFQSPKNNIFKTLFGSTPKTLFFWKKYHNLPSITSCEDAAVVFCQEFACVHNSMDPKWEQQRHL